MSRRKARKEAWPAETYPQGRIPTREDWRSEPWGIDTPCAYKNFFGKTRAQATQLFVHHSTYYQEDVMFMPRACFAYYVHPYMDYLFSEASRGDSDGASCFFGLIEVRAGDVASLGGEVLGRVRTTLDHLGKRQDWYDADESIYGDFRQRAAECFALLEPA